MTSTERYRRRRALGLCPQCGTRTHDRVHCLACRRKQARNLANFLARRRKAKLCERCATPCAAPTCGSCLAAAAVRQRELRRTRAASGVCAFCGGPGVVRPRKQSGSRRALLYCRRDYLRDLADRHLGTRREWIALRDLWKRQRGRCFYSGVRLTLGKNAVLDHVIPRKRGGRATPQNLVWAHETVNSMKGALRPGELRAWCHQIIAWQRSCSYKPPIR